MVKPEEDVVITISLSDVNQGRVEEEAGRLGISPEEMIMRIIDDHFKSSRS